MFRASLVLLFVTVTALAISIPARELKLSRNANLKKISLLKKLHQYKVQLLEAVETKLTDQQQELLNMLNNMTLDDAIPSTAKRLCEDSDISTTIQYVNSDEFTPRLESLLNEPSLQELIVLLLFSGDDYTEILDMIVELVSCPDSASGDLYNLEEEMTLEDIAPVFNERIQSEPDIMAIIDLLNTQPGLGYVQELVASASFQGIISDLNGLGVNTTRLLDLATELTGIPLTGLY